MDVTILGVHVKSAGYPNVTYRLRDLARSPRLRLKEINFPFRPPLPPTAKRWWSWKPLRSIWLALRLIYAHVYVLLLYMRGGRPCFLYIPYPAVFVLFCLSLLPKSCRPPHVVADCFISLYDTIVTDRKLLSAGSLGARALKAVESRAYRYAELIIVDTDLNAGYFMETFGLATAQVTALPLSIDESVFREATYEPHKDSCTVLFIGTFVPLQGVDVIARAVKALASRQDLRFRLIGFGQTAGDVAQILAGGHTANLEWVTEWRDSASLAEEIRCADICLGIFGEGSKTQRVWPLKNYAYMAVGRALITGATLQAEHLLQRADYPPFITVPINDPVALAAAIVDLAGAPERRRSYAANARRFYENYLSSRIALEELIERFDSCLTFPQQ